jgi:hypothetical protein
VTGQDSESRRKKGEQLREGTGVEKRKREGNTSPDSLAFAFVASAHA